MSHLPQFAQDIYDQLNGGKLYGAITYCGGREVRYGPFNPAYPQVEPDEHGLFDFANCLRFRPNTRRKTLIIIAIQPDDTYTVWYWREKKDHTGEIIARSDGFTVIPCKQWLSACTTTISGSTSKDGYTLTNIFE